MTQLLLIAGIVFVSAVYAAVLARAIHRRLLVDGALERAAGLVDAAVRMHLRRQNLVVLAMAAALGAVLFLAFGVAYQTGYLRAPSVEYAVAIVGGRAYGLWVVGAYLFGAGCALAAGQIAARIGARAGGRVADGARRSLDEPLQLAVRAGSVVGGVAGVLSLGGLGLLFFAHYVVAGQFGSNMALALAATPRIPLLMAGFALGASVVALLAQLAGGLFGTVADVGGDVAGTVEAALPADSPRNPATIADLAGDGVGDMAGRATGMFAANAVELLGAMVIAAEVYRDNRDLPSPTALVLFPLVARAFGLLASWFGAMVVRTDDRELPMHAIARGLGIAMLLYGVALSGCAKWLLGVHWLRLALCAVLGAVGCLLVLLAVHYHTSERYRPVRALAEAARGGASLGVLRGLVAAMQGTLAAVAVLTAVMVGGAVLGQSTGLAGGGMFGVALATLGLLGATPYVLGIGLMGAIVDAAGGLIEMTVAEHRPDLRARAAVLDKVGNTAKLFAKTLMSAGCCLGGVLLVAGFATETRGAAATPTGEAGAVWAAAFAGVVVIGAFVWSALTRVVHASRELVWDLRRELGAASTDASGLAPSAATGSGHPRLLATGPRGEPERRGWPSSRRPAAAPSDEPGERACVEIASRLSVRGVLLPTAVGLGLPLAIGLALRIASPRDSVAAAATAIAVLLIAATFAGALASLVFTNAGSAWDNAKKYIETGAYGGRFVIEPSMHPERSSAERNVNNPTYVAVAIGDTIGDPLKGVVGPALSALTASLSALALVLLPFFL